MERLDITLAPEHSNIEAAIHFARYAIAKSFVEGKKVLDIACGEGYGSYLLKQAGAKQVVGVDVSPQTIERARASFVAPGLEYLSADATDVSSIFPNEFFDVVVSLETIEHLTDPAAFLRSLKMMAKPGAVIIISCPNDHWYYPEEAQHNPFHIAKYRFEEFQQLAGSILGKDVQWSLGTAFFGFGSTPLSVGNDYLTVPGSWMSYREIDGAFLVSGEDNLKLSPANCSYFVGVWNAVEIATGAAVFPISMDDYVLMVRAQAGAQVSFAEQSEANPRRQQRNLGLRLQAVQAENGLIRERLNTIRAEKGPLRAENENSEVFAEFVKRHLDRQAYLDAYPDVRSAGVDPVKHWLEHGMSEGRSFFPAEIFCRGEHAQQVDGVQWLRFIWQGHPVAVRLGAQTEDEVFFAEFVKQHLDKQAYLDAYSDVRSAGVDPVKHWLEHGMSEGRSFFPAEVFCHGEHAQQVDGVQWLRFIWQGHPVAVRLGAQTEDEAFFAEFVKRHLDRQAYLDAYPDVRSAGVDPVKHWLEHGIFEGRFLYPSATVVIDDITDRLHHTQWLRFTWRGRSVAVKPRIGLVIDADGWAFSNIALQLQRHLADRFDFIVIPMEIIDNVVQVLLLTKDCQLVHFFWREYLLQIGAPSCRSYVERLGIPYDDFERRYVSSKKISTSIYDHLLLAPAELSRRADIYNSMIAGYSVGSNKLRDIYQAEPHYPSPTAVLEDGVDLTLFQPRNLERLGEVPGRELVIGWAGNSKWAADIEEDFKGVNSILKPAIERLRAEGFAVALNFADRQERYIPFSEMPEYYSTIDVYVCTSKIEGTPNPILESMACGVPIVSTDVGIVPQAFGPIQQRFILKERSVDCLVEQLKILLREPLLLKEMSAENLRYIAPWDWSIKARKFGDFFDSVLKSQ